MIMGSTRIAVRVLPVGLLFSTCFIIAPFVLPVKCFLMQFRRFQLLKAAFSFLGTVFRLPLYYTA
jgi:hypothetical protein